MPNDDNTVGLARDLTIAIDDLQSALHRASEATTAIRELVPRVAAVGALFDDLESVIRSGRAQVGAQSAAESPAVYSRPTLVPSATPQVTPAAPEPAVPASFDATAAATTPSRKSTPKKDAQPDQPASTEALTCFRLEFESSPGPLDLRTVDDAVSEHPDVRDVALLDYDGRKATLKVWIVASAKPVQVQESLTARAAQLFGASNSVSILALEDVA